MLFEQTFDSVGTLEEEAFMTEALVNQPEAFKQ